MKRKQKRANCRILRILCWGIFILFMVVILTGGGRMKAVSYAYVTGTSLWGIATEHCPEYMDKRKYINEVMKLNGMDDCTVYAGRIYQVPVYK